MSPRAACESLTTPNGHGSMTQMSAETAGPKSWDERWPTQGAGQLIPVAHKDKLASIYSAWHEILPPKVPLAPRAAGEPHTPPSLRDASYNILHCSGVLLVFNPALHIEYMCAHESEPARLATALLDSPSVEASKISQKESFMILPSTQIYFKFFSTALAHMRRLNSTNT